MVGERACGHYPTGSLAVGAGLVQAISELPGVGDGRPDIDLRHEGVTVRLITVTDDYYGLTEPHIEPARRISAVARSLGIPADLSAVQTVQVTHDTLVGPDVVPFYFQRAGIREDPRAGATGGSSWVSVPEMLYAVRRYVMGAGWWCPVVPGWRCQRWRGMVGRAGGSAGAHCGSVAREGVSPSGRCRQLGDFPWASARIRCFIVGGRARRWVLGHGEDVACSGRARSRVLVLLDALSDCGAALAAPAVVVMSPSAVQSARKAVTMAVHSLTTLCWSMAPHFRVGRFAYFAHDVYEPREVVDRRSWRVALRMNTTRMDA